MGGPEHGGGRARREEAARTAADHPPLASTWRDDDTDEPAPIEIESEPELVAGARVKHYEIIRELGRGGMARVMVARDLKLGRKVALKFIRTPSPRLADRLLVEARATARCSHENIVIIHEVDEHDGRPYLALELLEGQPLAHVLAESGPLAPRRAVEIMIPVVSALVHAHSLDIVHRDLKPENIFVTSRGTIKVLDFGIAKVFAPDEAVTTVELDDLAPAAGRAVVSAMVGTMPYMAPEQWGADVVDERTDIWAVGILLWHLLSGRHPLEPVSPEKLMAMASSPAPLPSIGSAVPELPPALEHLVDRCVAKQKQDRYRDAGELLDALVALTSGPRRRPSDEEDSPYLGLRSFQEADADRFFGRAREVTTFLARLRDLPLVGLVGPSGAGKSSFVQAGVVPALRESGDAWEVLVARPGRDPLANLAALIEPPRSPGRPRPGGPDLVRRLREEPGYLGVALRERARRNGGRVLLFVDQFEELYTLVADPAVRLAFTACLTGAADDPSSPLRVVVSMRSDFVDRVSEDRAFMDLLTLGLTFLPPPDRVGLLEALVQPLGAVGYRFEDPGIAEEIADLLLATPGALPLLQFAAAGLWETRDRAGRVLTRASYEAQGGIAGALAEHADRVLAGMAPQRQRIAGAVFQRLVTSERTRATAEIAELRGLAERTGEVEAVIDLLVRARLLVVHGGGEGADRAVEIVHEALIQSWPTLRRWLDERHEDAAFLEHLRLAARKWDASSRPEWLLLTGDASEEARRFSRRYRGELGSPEHDFLAAVVDRASRVARRRRALLVGAFGFLVLLVAASAVVLIRIRSAERLAHEQESVARAEADRARAAEKVVSDQLVTLRSEERARRSAEAQRATAVDAATRAQSQVELSREQLARANVQLEVALDRARTEAVRAAALAESERTAKEKTAALLRRERERVRELEEQKRTITTELK